MAARERETRKSKANETTQEGNTQRYRREKRRSHERIERERERDMQERIESDGSLVAHT